MDWVKYGKTPWTFECEAAAEFDHNYLHFLPLFTPDLSKDPLVRGKQVVEIKHTLKEARSLADPVQTAGHTRELHLRDACWKRANGELRKNVPNFYVSYLGNPQTTLRTGCVKYIHTPKFICQHLNHNSVHLICCHLEWEREIVLFTRPHTSYTPACDKPKQTLCFHVCRNKPPRGL